MIESVQVYTNGKRIHPRDVTHLFCVACVVLIFLALAAAKWYDVRKAEMLDMVDYRIYLMEGGK